MLNVTTRPNINTKIRKHFSKNSTLKSAVVFLSGKKPKQPRLCTMRFSLSAEEGLHALTTILPNGQSIQLEEVWSWSSLFVRRSSSCSSGESDNLIFTGSGSSVQVPIRKNGRWLTPQKQVKTKFSGKDYAAGLWSVIKLPELQVPSKTASDLKPAYWIWKLHRKTMKPIANFVITD